MAVGVVTLNHRGPYRRPDMRAQLPSMPTSDAAWRALSPEQRRRLAATWFEGRNRRDGTPYPVPHWTPNGAARQRRTVRLAVAMLIAVQAGTRAEDVVMGELDAARREVASLRLIAGAGYDLAQALSAVQELAPLALRSGQVAAADTAAIPKPRQEEVAS